MRKHLINILAYLPVRAGYLPYWWSGSLCGLEFSGDKCQIKWFLYYSSSLFRDAGDFTQMSGSKARGTVCTISKQVSRRLPYDVIGGGKTFRLAFLNS